MTVDTPWGPAPKDETRYCAAISVPGRNYLANGDPGYPDEYCDHEAEEGSEYCSEHKWLEDDEPEEVDPDEAYKRMKMGDDY